MDPMGFVLGPKLRLLAQELAEIYATGNLVVVAGAGVSRASGLPGWNEMVATIQAEGSTYRPRERRFSGRAADRARLGWTDHKDHEAATPDEVGKSLNRPGPSLPVPSEHTSYLIA